MVNNSFIISINNNMMCQILPSSIDCWVLSVSIIACIIAFITCIYTIYMYFLVKQQVVVQLQESLNNEAAKKTVEERTRIHVEEINNQILNNSLIKLIEKKHDFNNNYDYIYDYLSENSSLLKDGPVIMKANNLSQIIKDIEKDLSSIYEMIKVFEVNNELLDNASAAILMSMKELKSQDIIASNYTETDAWLASFNKNKTTFLDAIEHAVEQIKEQIIKE